MWILFAAEVGFPVPPVLTYRHCAGIMVEGVSFEGWTLGSDISELGELLQKIENRSKLFPSLRFFTLGSVTLNNEGMWCCLYSLPGLIMTPDGKDICVILQHPSNHCDTSLPLLSGDESESHISEQKMQWQYYYSAMWLKEFARLMDNLSIGQDAEKHQREIAASNATYFNHPEIYYQVAKRWAKKLHFHEAFECYMKAAEQDHKLSMIEVITYYKLGRGTEVDGTLANYWQARHDQISSPYALSQSILRQLDHELEGMYSNLEIEEPRRAWWRCLCCF
jgi:hypothetical protein